MKRLSLVLALVMSALLALAQGTMRNISGTVVDATGEPLIGASVLIDGTSVGTATDIDGKFSLSTDAQNPSIVVSYTGYSTQTIEVGEQSQVDITLTEGVNIEEVVVTGLGIRKEKKALGYAVTTLDNSALELRPEGDVSRILRGKIAGVDIVQTSGLSGSGTNIIIRGYSSITGSNQPLFVVDGVPFNATTNNDREFDEGGATASSRFLDLDPNNIAEISVLKGLSATVLYGESGRNGVVLVTTKNGNTDDLLKKVEVTIDQSVHSNTIYKIPEDQDLYGNGFHNNASGAFSNWGAPFTPGIQREAFNRLATRTPAQTPIIYPAGDGVATIPHPYSRTALNSDLPQYVGKRYDYRAYDNLQQFFEKGLISNTSVGVSSRLNRSTSINMNYGFRNADGFVPLDSYKRQNFGLGINTELLNGFKVQGSFNYSQVDRTAPPAGVSFSSNPTGASLLANIYYVPRSVDLYGLEYENPADNSSIFYRGGNDIQHPLWTANNSKDVEAVDRFFGNMQVSYKILPWLTAAYRYGVDTYSQENNYQINKLGRQLPDGLLSTSARSSTITDQLGTLNFDSDINDDLNLSGTVGFNVRSDKFSRTSALSTGQFVYGLFRHNNFINYVNTSETSRENLLGAFASTTVGFRRYLYLNLQARNDWTSTLEAANRSVLYPSISASFVPTDAFSSLANNKTLSYLKLRLGYGTSAGYPDPYQTRNVLSIQTRRFLNRAGQPVNINSVSDQLGNANLGPERHKELEFGVDARLFSNRVSFEASIYDKQSTDLIIPLSLDPSTGFTTTTVNVASVSNRGVELGLSVTPVQRENFSWSLNANFTQNENLIKELDPNVSSLLIEGYTNLGNFAFPDKNYGLIYGQGIKRAPDGQAIIGSNGRYQLADTLSVLGDPNADYRLNGGTTVSFHGLTFDILTTFQKGGDIYAVTPSTLVSRGILAGVTDFDRFVPVITPGVRNIGTEAEPEYVPNDIQITSTDQYWENSGVFDDENRVYDATYFKVREISLSYAIPKAILSRTPFGGISLTVSGQNLFVKAFGFPDEAGFDPEVLSLGVGNGRGFELMNVPSSKQIGGSLRLTF